MLTDSYRIWERKLTDFLRGEREQAYGLLTDSDRIWERKLDFLRIFYGVKESRLTDCLRILTGFGKESLRIFYGFFTGGRRAGLRIAYGFLPDLGEKLTDFLRIFEQCSGEQAYGLLTYSYRIWERKFTDFLRIFYGVKESRQAALARIRKKSDC